VKIFEEEQKYKMDVKSEDIRWRQRFQNFERAYSLLKETSQKGMLSEAERAGLIQFFEMAFELAWKLMKDYLEEEGFFINSPKEAVRQAFQSGLVKDGHVWMEALVDRNLTVHIYNESIAIEMERKIRQSYSGMLEELYVFFRNK
jgi:nucleotidyltransferase substrate binding protein (TIGR01987 family)